MISAVSELVDDKILVECVRYLGIYGKTFFPEAFYTKFSSLHLDILRAIDSPHQKIAIAAPRGLGKTTIAKCAVMRAIAFRTCQFITYISNSATSAELQTENIKRELTTNSLFVRTFGDIKADNDDPDFPDEVFAKKGWVAFGDILVLPRGSGQQVRGLLYKNHRPQFIIIDDLEKRDELENPENRRKLKEWFYSDLEKSVNRYDKDWKIVYMDTLKHHDSLLQELLESDDWYSLRLDLCDDNYNSKVPELISTEELKKEVESHRTRGVLDIFYMEYRNMPVSKEDQSFKLEYFKYFTEEDLKGKVLENVIIVDPAKTANMHSADSALIGIGVDYSGGGLYIRDIVSGKMFPDELYNEMFSMRRRLNAHVIGIEVTGLEEFIKQPILNEMQRRGPADTFQPVWLKARGGRAEGDKGKIARIRSLVSYYRQGFIYHNKNCCTKLEGQLITFPKSKLLDEADAEAYIIELLELGNRYFTSPDDNLDDSEAEFAELEYESALSSEYLRA